MARARNIKPSFFINDTLAENNCPLGRLLFIGMWTIADCNGNFEWRPARIKAQVLPYDECDIKKLAINLDKSGFIRFYSDGDRILINIPTFLDHQNPHKNEREKGCAVPVYSEDGRQLIDLTALTINRDKSGLKPEDSESNPADSLILIPDSCSLIEESLNGADAPDGGKPPSDGYSTEFESAWSKYPKRAGGNPKGKAWKAWKARIADGESVSVMTAGVDRYALFTRSTGKVGTEFVQQAATFFGPDRHYLEDWAPPNTESFDHLDYQEGIGDDGRLQ